MEVSSVQPYICCFQSRLADFELFVESGFMFITTLPALHAQRMPSSITLEQAGVCIYKTCTMQPVFATMRDIMMRLDQKSGCHCLMPRICKVSSLVLC